MSVVHAQDLQTTTKLVLGTRTSDLALWQTDHIIEKLQAAWPDLQCERMPFITKGDRTQAQGKPLPAIGGKGLFTAELEASLRSGQIDLAVHSLKDLPVEESPGLVIGAITSRADVRDALVARNGWTLASLPKGAIVGTSSTRRAAQLLSHRPDLTVRSIRGNVATRVRKVFDGDYDATLLAVAGLERLGLMANVTEILPLEIMLPAPGQGALAVQCRADDWATLDLLSAIDSGAVHAAVTAERTFLHLLGGGCSAPVAAYATSDSSTGALTLTTLVSAINGQNEIRVVKVSNNNPSDNNEVAYQLGHNAAQLALAQGAAKLVANQGAVTTTPTQQPLAKKRIVVTRAETQADSFLTALKDLGAESLLVPAIEIVPLADLAPLQQALRQLTNYDWILFTSVNSVGIVSTEMQQLGLLPFHHERPQIAAIGTATAAALSAAGLKTAFVPEQYIAEEIVAGLGEVAGKRILLPQARIARETLAERLAVQGAIVDALPVYQTVSSAINVDARAALQMGVDLLTFTSGSTVRNFFNALDFVNGGNPNEKRLALGNPVIACIGPVTAEAVRALGLQVDIEADEHTIPGLISAITAYYQ